MKKKNLAVFSLLAMLALVLSACLFDSDDTALSGWLSDQGLPDSYKVQTLSIDGIVPVSAKSYPGTPVLNAATGGALGAQAGLVYDLVFDIAFDDSAFLADMAKADSASAFLALFVDTTFYRSKHYPSENLPFEETLDIKVSWKIDSDDDGDDLMDSLSDIPDSVWYEDLKNWEPDNSADTTYELSLGAKDSLLKIDMPSALVEDIKKVGPACHLQLRISAPEASHAYQIFGTVTTAMPQFRMKSFSEQDWKMAPPFRMAKVFSYSDSDEESLLLHTGTYDSLVVEMPAKDILEALSEFYGDAFPFDEGNGYDVRQAVVLAQWTFARDDAAGMNESELGLPIQVVVSSLVDSLGEEVCKRESYRVNRKLVDQSGHPNMVFYDGDSLTLQTTLGMRDFINRANEGRNIKMTLRLGFPMLAPKDSMYMDYIDKDTGDSIYKFFDHFDYARYDFTSMMESPVTLKLWLATKRGDEE